VTEGMIATEMLMVFQPGFCRFSGTINCPHLAWAKAGVETTRAGQAPGSKRGTTPEAARPGDAPPMAKTTASTTARAAPRAAILADPLKILNFPPRPLG